MEVEQLHLRVRREPNGDGGDVDERAEEEEAGSHESPRSQQVVLAALLRLLLLDVASSCCDAETVTRNYGVAEEVQRCGTALEGCCCPRKPSFVRCCCFSSSARGEFFCFL